MARVKYTKKARSKFQQIGSYFSDIDEALGLRAVVTVRNALEKLIQFPQIGRPYVEDLRYRERVIEFGSGHFLALYLIEENGDILVLSIKHEKEAQHEADGEL